eukprot:6139-Pelagomonas_calceolata.AAC.1
MGDRGRGLWNRLLTGEPGAHLEGWLTTRRTHISLVANSCKHVVKCPGPMPFYHLNPCSPLESAGGVGGRCSSHPILPGSVLALLQIDKKSQSTIIYHDKRTELLLLDTESYGKGLSSSVNSHK